MNNKYMKLMIKLNKITLKALQTKILNNFQKILK